MAEPHELEERVTVLIAARQPECEFATKAQIAACDHDACQCRGSARAVLALVREEQEKGEGWIEGRLYMRQWWLSHTAPQEK